ncbi:decapping endonuclease targeting mRNA [Diplodia seriata]|uniref:Decapping endonuclease targeting mRNA n=1 Tax=Diplodia seriata TaxID=420778 RepID=A0ABR3CD81_9PEZI
MSGALGDAGRRDLESGDEQHVQKMVEGAMHHNYVELKTTEWIDDRLQDKKKIQQKLNNYDRRKIKYWGQSTMPLEVLKTNNIPATIRNTSRLWNSVTCVQTLGAFLERKIKYWGQSHLIGCPTIIVGKKDEDQQSTMPLEVVKTNNIPATNAVAGRFRHSVGSRLLSPPQP